jgi:predicted nucleic acid-binding protein
VPDSLWVLDTSIVAGWFFFDEPLRDVSLIVRARLRDQPHRFLVPHLFHSEIVHVLARKSARDADFVRTAIELLLRLGVRTIALSESALLRTAHWACRGLSGYDATFTALAEDLGGKWLTADESAAKIAGRERAITLRSWARAEGR